MSSLCAGKFSLSTSKKPIIFVGINSGLLKFGVNGSASLSFLRIFGVRRGCWNPGLATRDRIFRNLSATGSRWGV